MYLKEVKVGFKKPVKKIGPVIITQDFKGNKHRGLDIRTVRFPRDVKGYIPVYGLQKIQVPEKCIVKRVKRDKSDNGIIVIEPLWSELFEIKFIHINIEKSPVRTGQVLEAGAFIGKSEVRGQSTGYHLHLEGLIEPRKYIDMKVYFDEALINWKFKWNLRKVV